MNTNTTYFIFLFYLLLIGIFGWATFPEHPSAMAETKDSLIKILTPQDGEIVGQTFEILYELREGLSEESVEIFIDGMYQKEVKHLCDNVKRGKHEILVKVSTNEPEPLIDWNRIAIEVK